MDYTLCRLCYEKEANASIFQSGNDVQILCKILYCCKSLNIHMNDGLPAHICNGCDVELDDCYRFLRKCEGSDRILRSILGSQDSQASRQQVDYPKIEVKTEDDDPRAEELPFPIEDYETDALRHEPKEIKNITQKRPRNKVKLKLADLSCSVCRRKCVSASALAVHMRIHTNEKPFHCPSCDKNYKDSGTLKRHIERNHLPHRERKFICENCGKGFYTKRDITIHMRIHTGETPYVCPICSTRFTQLSAMTRHKKRHMGDINKNHSCSTCRKSFHTKDELKKHHSVHEEERHYSCPICHIRFKQKGNINKHMAVHSDPKRFVCNHCGRTFNMKGGLKSHIDRKHSEKSGYCNTCCKNVSNIEIHMWRHTGQKSFKCEFCPSTFYELRGLALHVNFKHKKTDRYKCIMEGCAMSFPSRPMMMYHIARFHDMQTPFPCDRCPRGFYRKSDLARHKIGTHKERLL